MEPSGLSAGGHEDDRLASPPRRPCRICIKQASRTPRRSMLRAVSAGRRYPAERGAGRAACASATARKPAEARTSPGRFAIQDAGRPRPGAAPGTARRRVPIWSDGRTWPRRGTSKVERDTPADARCGASGQPGSGSGQQAIRRAITSAAPTLDALLAVRAGSAAFCAAHGLRIAAQPVLAEEQQYGRCDEDRGRRSDHDAEQHHPGEAGQGGPPEQRQRQGWRGTPSSTCPACGSASR